MSPCEQLKRLLTARKLRDGDGIIHPSWLSNPTPGDVVTALWAMGFKPEHASSKRSPSPFRRYFDQKGKRTLILEPWTYQHLGDLPDTARTKPKRIRLYQEGLSKRLEDEGITPSGKAWWPGAPKVWIRFLQVQELWTWEATAIVLVDELCPTPDLGHPKAYLKTTKLDLMPSRRSGQSSSMAAVLRPRTT